MAAQGGASCKRLYGAGHSPAPSHGALQDCIRHGGKARCRYTHGYGARRERLDGFRRLDCALIDAHLMWGPLIARRK